MLNMGVLGSLGGDLLVGLSIAKMWLSGLV